MSNPLPTFERAIELVCCYFAREELIGISGHSPYELAAAVLAGYSNVPGYSTHAKTSSFPILSIEDNRFASMDNLQNETVSETVGRGPAVFPTGREVLELKTERHQYILRLLAQHIRAQGLLPTYNRKVDLRTQCKERDVFLR